MSQVKKAERLPAAQAAKRDRAKMTVLVTKPAESDVEGQSDLLVNRPIECPWCGATGYSVETVAESDYGQCGSCGQYVTL